MRIDGRAIAETILTDLTHQITDLKKKGVTPTLAVIQIGDDPGSIAYIAQKKKAADRIGVRLIHTKFPIDVTVGEVNKTIDQYNNGSSIHGIILQRPLPTSLNAQRISLCSAIRLSKDVDGFLPNSPYPVPVAAAVLKILRVTFSLITYRLSLEEALKKQINERVLKELLITKKIIVLGRGETAGKPIAEALIKQGIYVSIIHSETPHPDDAIRTGDVVISCVGKSNVVRRDNIKEGVILVSVGLYRDSEGKLHGDYEEDEIKDVARLYTPTPGGVGPVNVACLMSNLVAAASRIYPIEKVINSTHDRMSH